MSAAPSAAPLGNALVLLRRDAPLRLGPGEPCGGLLELDGGAGALEGRLRLLGVLLGRLLEHRLRGVVDELLGLLQPEARERPDLLDDLDLLVAGRGEDDVELVLLLGC